MSLNPILMSQLQQLTIVPFKIDGKLTNTIPNEFYEIVFPKIENNSFQDEIRVEFQDYILNPFPGFDFHTKWNHDTKPYAKVMYGKISKQTQGMYYFEVHSDTNSNLWCGWCPKKSCVVTNL